MNKRRRTVPIDRVLSSILIIAVPLVAFFALATSKPSGKTRSLSREIAESDCPAIKAPTLPTAPRATTINDVVDRVLVIYNNTTQYADAAELDAIMVFNLATQGGAAVAVPAADYQAGWAQAARTIIYVGTLVGEQPPAALTADILATNKPVVWLGSGMSSVAAAAAPGVFASRFGFVVKDESTKRATTVTFRQTDFTRTSDRFTAFWEIESTTATVLATVKPDDGSPPRPWAVRSGNLTYISEVPFTDTTESSNHVVLSALLQEQLRPDAPERKRAIVRIEDVNPSTKPGAVRATVDALKSQGVAFGMQVIPVYKDPANALKAGQEIRLADRPELVDALRYAIANGGELILHGYTHQYGRQPNPYVGASAADFEFYLTHINTNNSVILDGPPPEEALPWWSACRVELGLAELAANGLPKPSLFTTAHYAAGITTQRAVDDRFVGRLERPLYPPGLLSGSAYNYSKAQGQFLAYPVVDIVGGRIIPENLGNRIPRAFNNNTARTGADIVENARRLLVVRDGVASFFWHGWLADDKSVGPQELADTVAGIKALGYSFVLPSSVTP